MDRTLEVQAAWRIKELREAADLRRQVRLARRPRCARRFHWHADDRR
ncbi:MAG: hypothetical protein ACRD0U_07235 [Acidimicrobiales bacterium]